MAKLLLQENCTIIHCHSQTQDLPRFTQQADLLIAAIGKPEFFSDLHIKAGATVVDVGIHRKEDGSLCGDCDFESMKEKATALSPVPGGVGPLTIAVLLENTITAAERRSLGSR